MTQEIEIIIDEPIVLTLGAQQSLPGGVETDPTVPAHVKAITTTDIENWNSTAPHSHDNKAVLDSITAPKVAEWDAALQVESDPIFNAHTVKNITNGTGFLKNNGSGVWNYDSNSYSPLIHTHDFTSLTGRPTTLTGYGITDAIANSHVVNAITGGNITNWNTAFANSHTHANQTALDAVTTAKINNWDAALQVGDLAGLATENYVDTKVAGIVDAAPETLNTLNELAAALGDDPNFATTVATQIGQKANTADLGTAAAQDSTAFATAAQGAKADTALQSETDPTVPAYAKTLTDFSIIKTDTDPLYKSISYTPSWNDITSKPNIPEQVNIIQGSNIVLSGTYPNITISSTGSSGGGGDVVSVTGEGSVEVDNTDITNPIVKLTTATETKITNAVTAYLWGDHSTEGYLKDFTESDPTVPAWAKQPLKPSYNKSEIGLGNVDNTSDVDKPISTVAQTALDTKADKTYVDNELLQKADSSSLPTVIKANETLTSVNDLSLTGNILTISYTGENGVVQTKNVDLSSLTTTDVKVSNAAYNAATNIITITNSDASTFNIDLSEFSIIVSTDGNGVTTLVQEGVTKATISKAGQTGSYDDLINKPTLGTASTQDSTAFATAAQGVKADTALQSETDPTVPAWAKQPTKPSYNKSEIGLGNVDNTSDANKPVSTAVQNELNLKANTLDLSDVATTGSYNDLSDKPTIPTVPVQSVSGKTGDVTLVKADILDLLNASQTVAGLMSETDKARLDALHALMEESSSNDVVDTINEILLIFNNYPEGVDLLTTLAGKVDKIAGKGLSENDYTDADKTKLSGIEVGAQVNTVNSVAGKTGDVVLNKADVYTITTTAYDNTAITDAKCDGYIYKKIGSKYYVLSSNYDEVPLSLYGTGLTGLNNFINAFIKPRKKIVIDSVIDLNNTTITIPADVILIFKGGKITNGTLTGTDTKIINDGDKLIFDNVLIRGTWNIDKVHSSWVKTYKNGYVLDKEPKFDSNGDRAYLTKVSVDNSKYYINGVEKSFGTISGLTYDDDTINLQQVLNFRAHHTTIGNSKDDIYMIDATTGENIRGRTDFGGLVIESFDNKTVKLNGVLKAIPNNKAHSSILRIGFCNNLLVTGNGEIAGELFEHIDNSGEWGMGVFVHSTVGLVFENITIRDCWGDGVFVSYSNMGNLQLTPDEIKRNDITNNHTWDNIKIYDCGRTGFVYEIGNYTNIINSEISYNARHRWKMTAAGVDYEPFGSADAGMRTCLFIKFEKNRLVENRNANLRFERCGNILIDNNYFEGGHSGVSLINCMNGSFSKSFAETHVNDFQYDGFPPVGQCKVINNTAHAIREVFLQSETFYTFQSFYAENNVVTSSGRFITGSIADTIIKNNTLYNLGAFCKLNMVHNTKIIDNDIHHLNLDNNEGSNIWYNTAFRIGINYGDTPDAKFPQYVLYNVLIEGNTYMDYTGKFLPESRLSNRMTSLLRCPVFLHPATDKTVMLVKNFVIRNNKIPREFIYTYKLHYANDWLENQLPTRYTLENNINIDENHMLIAGDTWYDRMYCQRATVVKGGNFKVSDKWIKWEPNKVITEEDLGRYLYFESLLRVYRIGNAGTLGATEPVLDWIIMSGDVNLERIPDNDIDVNAIEVRWEGVGTCTTVNRPIQFNSKGRMLFDSDINKVIMWSGSDWTNTDGSSL